MTITADTYDVLTGEEVHEDTYFAVLQDLIDTGTAWQLEGSTGRAAIQAIEEGLCILGPKPVRDTYNNLVPAWWIVDPGTKGSPEYAGQERPEEPGEEEKVRLCAAVGVEYTP